MVEDTVICPEEASVAGGGACLLATASFSAVAAVMPFPPQFKTQDIAVDGATIHVCAVARDLP